MNLYEVGDIFLTMSNESPALRFVGTWELIGKGKTLVGVDPNDTDFNVVNKTGGEKTHKLTANESGIQSHGHTISHQGWYNAPPNTTGSERRQMSFYTIGGDETTTAFGCSNASANAKNAHNNLQPYLTCYIWCRTA